MTVETDRREAELRVSLMAACQFLELMISDAEHGCTVLGNPTHYEGHRKCLEAFRAPIGSTALAVPEMAMVVLAASAFVNRETDLAGIGQALTDLHKADPRWLEHMLDLVKARKP